MLEKLKKTNLKGYCQAIVQIIKTNSVAIILGILTLFSAILSILSIALVNECKDNKELIITILPAVVTFCFTLLGFIFNIVRNCIDQKKIIFHKNSSLEIKKYLNNLLENESKYKIIDEEKSVLLYSDEENSFVKEKLSSLLYSKKNPHYSIPYDISKNSLGILNYFLNNEDEKKVFNSKKIRLNAGMEKIIESYNKIREPDSNLKEDNKYKIVQLSKTNYFNSLCTNEIIDLEIRSANDTTDCFNGYSLIIADENKLNKEYIYTLSESHCSNHIGISTLVKTRDDYLIISKQNKRSLINPDLYSVTSSGSADYKDIRGCKYFSDILIKAMERELWEECNFTEINKYINNVEFKKIKESLGNKRKIEKKDLIAETKIIGYGRLLDRGGKPEFFGITKINLTAKEFELFASTLIEKSKSDKTDYPSIFTAIPVSDSNRIKAVIDEKLNNGKGNTKITIQLKYYQDVLLD